MSTARLRRLLFGAADEAPRAGGEPGSGASPAASPAASFATSPALAAASAPGSVEALWRQFATFPYHARSADASFDFVVARLREQVPAAAYFLYLRPPGDGGPLALEHADLAFERDPALGLGRVPDADLDVLRTPQLTLTPRDEHRRVGPVVEWCGECLNVPLELDGELVGVVLAGPGVAALPGPAARPALDAFGAAAAAAARTITHLARLSEGTRTLASRAAVRERMLVSALDLGHFVDLLLDLALTGTRSDAGFVAMADAAGNALTVRASRNLPDMLRDRLDLSASGTFEWVPESGDVMVVRDFELLAAAGVQSVLAVPMTRDGRLLGVFCLMAFGRAAATESTLAMLTLFTEQIELVLGNERFFREFTDRYLETVRALSRAYDARSTYTAGHSERVARLGVAIARQLGLPQTALDAVREAGLLHDAGMCAVVEISDSFQADFDHPTIGASMIEMLPIPPEIADGVRTHHEWYNGWGFPGGLKGAEIPQTGQILAVAEYVVEAAAGDRVRAPLNPAQVEQEVQSRRGVQFAPAVADAFLALPPGAVG